VVRRLGVSKLLEEWRVDLLVVVPVAAVIQQQAAGVVHATVLKAHTGQPGLAVRLDGAGGAVVESGPEVEPADVR
jgi:hypothetical protein